MPKGVYNHHKTKTPIYTKENKEKIRLAHKGMKRSIQHCENISKAKKGNKNYNWGGGEYENGDGYILVYSPNHPFSNNRGYVRRSRLVMEKHLGRYLTPKEVVHHKGIRYSIGSIENKQDDRIENLQLFPNQSKHAKFHSSIRNITYSTK